jgi:hypothetical protein
MRLPKSSLRRSAVLLFSILTFPLGRATAQTTNIPARITQSVDEKNLFVLKGNVHPLARLEFDQGVLPDALTIGRMLLLLQRSPEQEASLTNLLDDQQNKSSRNYHAWLTPEQFGKQFGPADADIQAITAWLTSQGFTAMKIGPGRQVIEFSGTAGQVRNAFRTEIHRYAVNGEEHAANTNDPQIPAGLAPVVAGVVSLHNFPRKSHARVLGQFRRTVSKPGLEPLFTFPNPFNGMSFYGLGPGDFATIYNSKPLIAAGNDGTGQTIAIVGETNLKVQDVQQFRKMFALSANFDTTNVVLNGEDPGITSIGEEGEADLDVEWSGAVAPGATVKLVVSASTLASAGIDLSALYIVEHNLAGVMSESYGTCEKVLGSAGNAFYNSLWEQAAAQGITVVLSSGDGGSAGCDDFNTPRPATQGLAVSGLASTPFNVSVGGTDFDQVNNWAAYWNPTNDPTGTSAISYIPEIPWSENCAQIGLTGCGASAPSGSLNIAAGSGGASSVYGKPNWQMGVAGVPNDNHRDQPDVSLFASPGFDGTGYVYCQSDQTISGASTCDLNASTSVLDFGIIGGTSASAPAFAGIMALVNQKQATTASPAPRQGNANYVLYALAKKAGASCTSTAAEAAGCIFNDVTRGNSALPTGLPGVGTNSVPCQGGSLNCSVTTAGSNGVLVDPGHPTVEAWTATAGYDMTTGLGTVNVNNLATNWGSVSTIPTTTTLTLSPTTGITHGTGENVTVGITVKPNTGTSVPAGDVSLIATFPDGTTQGFDQFTLASGAASGVQTQSMPGGTYNVSAHYTGDGTNAPSDSTPVQVTVGKESSQTFIVVPSFDSQSNLLNGNATSVTYGSRYVIRMYVTDKNGVASTTGSPGPTCYQENVLTCPSGTVTLTDNGALLGTGGGGPGVYNLNDSGYSRDLTPALTGGTYSLVAKYSGDSSYQPSTSATDSFTVTPAPGTQLIFTNNPQTALIGSSVTLSVLGIPNLPSGATATGSVSLFEGSTQIAGPVPVACYHCAPGEPVDFTASLQASFSTSGNHSITAQYSGDADYAAATSTRVTVDAVYPTTITQTVSATTINYGQSVTTTASVMTSPKSPPMTGTFTFNSSYTQIPGPVIATLTTDSSGNQILTATVTTTPQSSEAIQAIYSGDVNYASVSATSNFVTVILPDFSMTPNPAYLTITAGQTGSQQLTITAANNLGSTVNFSCSPDATIGITCSFSPTSENLTNSTPATATVTLSTLPPSATLTAAFPASPGVKRPRWPGGRGWPVGLDLVCLVALLLSFLPRQSRTKRLAFGLVAAFSLLHVFGCGGGSAGGGGGGGGPVPTSVAITVSATKVPQGTSPSVTLSANVTSTKTVTGTITFWEKGNDGALTPPLTIVANSASGQVALPFVGTHQIYAQYSGDSQNQGSQSSTLNVVATGTTYMGVQATNGPVSQSSTIWVTIQ